MVFYESPHRLGKALTQFAEHFGAERQASVSVSYTHLDVYKRQALWWRSRMLVRQNGLLQVWAIRTHGS